MGTADERRRSRLHQEQSILEQAFPTAQLDVDAGLLILRGHRLPPGWTHEETDVLIEVPEQYPSTPPDNVCARSDLMLAGGGTPANNQGQRDIAGQRWLQFSYHVEPSDWRPHADVRQSSTLVDFLHGALTRFEEAS